MRKIFYLIMIPYCILFVWFAVLVIYSGAVTALFFWIFRIKISNLSTFGFVLYAAAEVPKKIVGL